MALVRKIAIIDLDRRHVETFSLPKTLRERFLGGSGIATYLFCSHSPKKCHPLSRDNICVVSAGVLGGTLSAPRGNTIVSAKSVSTGLMARVFLNGFFAGEMRQAGFDHLVLKGRAKSKTYLFIQDGHIRFKEAIDLEGERPPEQHTAFDGTVAGGDNQCIYVLKEGRDRYFLTDASSAHDTESDTNGLGTVLAAKNILAMVCRGTLDIEVKDPDGLIEYERNHGAFKMDAKNQSGDSEGFTFDQPAGKIHRTEIKQTIAHCLGLPFGGQVDKDAFDLKAASARIRLNTGMVLSKSELSEIAYRCITMERLYNIREGIAAKGGQAAREYRKNGWTRKEVVKKGKVFDGLGIDDLWPYLKE